MAASRKRKKRIRFSRHACQRMRTRAKAPISVLRRAIKRNRFVSLPPDKNGNSRLLIYSIRDRRCYIAVYDSQERNIITAFPASQTNRGVTLEKLEQAEARARSGLRPENGTTEKPAAEKALPQPQQKKVLGKWQVRLMFFGLNGGVRVHRLARLPEDYARDDPQEIVQLAEFRDWLQQKLWQFIAAEPLLSGPKQTRVWLQRGKKGQRHFIDLDIIENNESVA